MDLWVVAAAAGAGYLVKYWQNISGEQDGGSEFCYSGNLIQRQSESRNLLQQIREQTCPLRRLEQRGLRGEVSSERGDEVSDGKFQEMDWLGGGLAAGDASTSGNYAKISANVRNYESYNVLMRMSLPPGYQVRENFPENVVGIGGKNEGFDNSGDVLPKFEINKLTRSRLLRSSRRSSLEYAFSSLPSPLTPTVRPLLVTDGNQIVNRPNSDLFGCWDGDKNYKVRGEGVVSLEENDSALLGTHSSQQTGLVELPRKPEQRHVKERSSISSTRFSGGPFHSQGSTNGMFFLFIGITIGIMSAIVANMQEVHNLNERFKQTQNLVRDLQEELEMKGMLTVKELASEDNQSQEIIDCSSSNREPIASSCKLEEFTGHSSKEAHDPKDESHELMSKIEAELEAELERLELNLKSSTLERLSDFVEIDPDFEAYMVQGELKVDKVQPGGDQSESDSDATETSTNHTHTANYAVSPRELTLRLHELIESRLEARIKELEASLQNSQNRVHFLEWQNQISQKGLIYGEVGSSSTPGSPTFVNKVNDMDRPLVINLSREAIDAYEWASKEIIRVTDADQDTPDAVCENNLTDKDMLVW